MTAYVSEEKQEEWAREVALVRLTGACPYCDGEVDMHVTENPDGSEVADWQCTDCDRPWLAKVEDLDGSIDRPDSFRVE